jgi:hypothetical protein
VASPENGYKDDGREPQHGFLPHLTRTTHMKRKKASSHVKRMIHGGRTNKVGSPMKLTFGKRGKGKR